jgi:hypothetical protein
MGARGPLRWSLPWDHQEDRMTDERQEIGGPLRGPPGRRSVDGRTEAVLALLTGDASADQLVLG